MNTLRYLGQDNGPSGKSDPYPRGSGFASIRT